jgi:hypothetical protein
MWGCLEVDGEIPKKERQQAEYRGVKRSINVFDDHPAGGRRQKKGGEFIKMKMFKQRFQMQRDVERRRSQIESKSHNLQNLCPKTDIYERSVFGSKLIPEAKGEQREAVSVVWSRGVGSVDPWRVPSRGSEVPGFRLFLCRQISIHVLAPSFYCRLQILDA